MTGNKLSTYVFFLRLGVDLLASNGRLGYITPNTFLSGKYTAPLRSKLLRAGRITQIVDLPQGIWKDANVDCTLLFLTRDANAEARHQQQTAIFSMNVRDNIERLNAREWKETFTQAQSAWLDDAQHIINIRFDDLLSRIELACAVPLGEGDASKILRLGDVTDDTTGIKPYTTADEGQANIYIKPRRDVPANQPEWKPLLDGNSYIGRYELRWATHKPYLKYENWLQRPRAARYFDSPKILLQAMRNKALKRRLVATFDESGFYNRHNFSNVVTRDPAYNLKYLLALFNSSLLNYWYGRHYDNVNVTAINFRQLPIYPADAATQAELVALVDELLAQHAALNVLREQDYVIRTRRDGTTEISVPYDALLHELQTADRDFPVLSLFNARAAGWLRLPPQCDPAAQIGHVFTTAKYPDTVVLKKGQLWLEVDDHAVRDYLVNYLARPQWQKHSFDEISSRALVPEPDALRSTFLPAVARRVEEIEARLAAIAAADAAIDARVLDLYGITDPVDRARILGESPPNEEEVAED